MQNKSITFIKIRSLMPSMVARKTQCPDLCLIGMHLTFTFRPKD